MFLTNVSTTTWQSIWSELRLWPIIGEKQEKIMERTIVAMKEKNSERFVRVVETRTNKAIEAIERVGECADVRIYEYSQAQVEKVFIALEKAVSEARRRYTNGSGRKTVFRLNDINDGDEEL